MSEDTRNKTAQNRSVDDSPVDVVIEEDEQYFQRYGIDELTGLPVVNARPGARLVTSEEILEQLEDFP